jgi:glycosyltransferase involved in cell wall biosynthesis
VVSTPYAYARERLAGGRGVLVAPGSPEALAHALVELLGNREERETIGRRAYEYSRHMTWPKVGAEYAAIFAEAARVPVSLHNPAANLAVFGG